MNIYLITSLSFISIIPTAFLMQIYFNMQEYKTKEILSKLILFIESIGYLIISLMLFSTNIYFAILSITYAIFAMVILIYNVENDYITNHSLTSDTLKRLNKNIVKIKVFLFLRLFIMLFVLFYSYYMKIKKN